MAYPASAAADDIDFFCTDEELFLSLERVQSGAPLPRNVIRDINPYQYMPSNLPDDIWFLVHSEVNMNSKYGFWKAKGEACKLFSNSFIIGWRTTLEFYEGQIPHEHKTNWMMQEHWILYKELCENSKAKEAELLCRVFLGGEQMPNHEKRQKLETNPLANENFIQSKLPITPEVNCPRGSTSKCQMQEDDEIVELAVAGKPSDQPVENHPETDYLYRGDFLELLDLDNPASPSSSENSSCLTMSSDACFDALALLQELKEREENGDDSKLNYSVSAPIRLDEVVFHPASHGSLVRSKIDESPDKPISNTEYTELDENLSKQTGQDQKAGPVYEGQLQFHNTGASSSSLVATPSDEEKKATVGRMKKLKKKYLCFMPF